jgi:hypothetical protein
MHVERDALVKVAAVCTLHQIAGCQWGFSVRSSRVPAFKPGLSNKLPGQVGITVLVKLRFMYVAL